MLQLQHAFISVLLKWNQETIPPPPDVTRFCHYHTATPSPSTPTSSLSLPGHCSLLPQALNFHPSLRLHVNGLLRTLFALLAALSILPCQAHAAWFQVGVVGPWGCDPLFAKAFPNVAAQLAINRINRDPMLHGMPVRFVSFMENTPHGIRRTLAKVRKMKEIRAVILCMHSVLIGGSAQKLLLETAYDMQMIDGSLVFVPYDTLLYSLPYLNATYPAVKNNSKLLRAYDAMLTITIDSPRVSFYDAYREAIERGEVARTLKPQQVQF
ncbi:hypothetical protein XENOCAPTIV_009752 [Xenoophorus captivus]|uniref:Receptor ligand binding region domain-containing protein n=1 Tax=Xenoophorus captivus TaxID=1517983 RepID=A0ABV0RPR9_9TELE